jgi:hypothetical protein
MLLSKEEKLYIFEEQLDWLEEILRTNMIRLAGKVENPHEPLRPNKEILYDETGKYVLPHSEVGISLVGSMRQLQRLMKPGMKKYFMLVNPGSSLPSGFKLHADRPPDHYAIVVTERMLKSEYDQKIAELITSWRLLGRFKSL